MITKILSIVAPVFGLVLVGWLYARRHGPDMTAANRINLDIFTPALIFHVLSGKDFQIGQYLDLAVGAAVVVLGSGLIALVVCRATGTAYRTLVPPMMFNNSGNMGLPLAVLSFGEHALPAAVVLFLVENLLHFTLGIRILDHQRSLAGLLRMPLVLACLLGLSLSLLDIHLPKPVALGIEMLGQVAIPLMLFALGVRLTEADWSHWRIGLLGAFLRPAAGLIAALPALLVLPLPGDRSRQLVLFAALPPAVLNYVLAEQYRQEPEAVASIVIWGNMASLVTIPLTLAVILR
ncbi:MAG: AEC family transporter [Chromatiaceae bacterium]